MRIVHVIASLGVGGAETLLAEITKRQMVDGHEVHIVTLLDRQDVAIADGIKVHHLLRKGERVNAVRLILAIRRAMGLIRPDVVHSHMLHSNLLIRISRSICSVPKLVNTVHSAFETDNRFYRLGYRWLERAADVTVFVSEEAMDRYVAERLTSSRRAAVVRNGIDTSIFCFDMEARNRIRRELSIEEGDFLITAIGRLTKQKDYPNLLESFARVADVRYGARLLIVGEGDLEQEIVQRISDLGLESKVTLAGVRHDIPMVLSASDMLVLSSEYEGFGLVLAEAMACEVPVVATDCGGTAEVVSDCGRLVPRRDPVRLAAAMIGTMSMTTEERRAIGVRGRERICKNFSIDQTVKNWYQVYRSVGA